MLRRTSALTPGCGRLVAMAEEIGPAGEDAVHPTDPDHGAVDVTGPAWGSAAEVSAWATAGAATPARWRRSRRAAPDDLEPPADWAWVEEWRRGGEPTPWGPGLFLATFAGLIIGCAVYVISVGLADNVLVAVAANVVVAVGLTPALWMSRGLPVLRWVGLGGALGTVVAWISLLFFPHF